MQKNILLVDDESSLRRSLFLGLKQEGYSVEPCENGLDAIKMLHSYEQKKYQARHSCTRHNNSPILTVSSLARSSRQNIPGQRSYSSQVTPIKLSPKKVESLSSVKILEKPFSAKDLTEQIENLIEEDSKNPDTPEVLYKEQIKKAEQTEITTFSAYAILKIDKSADFFGTFRKLYFDKNVLYCDATKGEYDIFLLIQSNSLQGCRDICENHIKKIEGVKEVEFLEVSNPILDDSLKNVLNVFSIESEGHQTREIHNSVCSYIMVEIEKEKLDTIYPTLYFDDNVVYCDYTEKQFGIISSGNAILRDRQSH